MKLLTKKEVANMLNCKEDTVSYYVSSRQVPFIKIGKEARFNPESIKKWVEERELKPMFDLTEGI